VRASARSTTACSEASRPSRFGRDVCTVGDATRRDEDGYLWIIGRTVKERQAEEE
jgi:acyl-coenzyme A synthetase/AMP-(fatty) acid ligase